MTEPTAVTERAAEEPTGAPRQPFTARFLQQATSGGPVLVTILAIVTALILGSLLIIFSDKDVLATWGYFFAAPGDALSASWHAVASAYGALLTGSIGDPATIAKAFSSGRATDVVNALTPLSETFIAAAPLIFTGLSVALGFRSGLFNIGAEGQLVLGGLAAGFVGFSLHGLPAVVHLPLALLAGFAAGALWGFIPGFLKARTGAHEVITTIMLNYVALNLSIYCLTSSVFR